MSGVRTRRREDRSSRGRAAQPTLEGLENRLLLYATTGGRWLKPKLISYSFVPDGTSIGGVASNLQASLNARFATAAWKSQFAKAAAVWQKVANINFWQVADNGSPIGTSGAQQRDSRFGDIRIGGFAQSSGQLAFAYLPPPANGGTNAGDIFFNTNQSWQINGTTYDLLTVAIHEFGHSLGLDHSTTSTAAMWPAYNGTKQAVITDDIYGIQTVYNGRQNDFFDANGANNASSNSDNITSYLDATGKLTLSALDSTTPIMIGSGDNDWFKITVPANTTGTMVVKMQSTGLSVLSPSLAVYNATGTTILGQQSSTDFGDTVTVTLNGVTPGQVYNIRAKGATTGDAGFGAYGLQVNFGASPQDPVTAPNTFAAEQTDQGGGTLGASTDDHSADGWDGADQSEDPSGYWTNLDPEVLDATDEQDPSDPGEGYASSTPHTGLEGDVDTLFIDPRFLGAGSRPKPVPRALSDGRGGSDPGNHSTQGIIIPLVVGSGDDRDGGDLLATRTRARKALRAVDSVLESWRT